MQWIDVTKWYEKNKISITIIGLIITVVVGAFSFGMFTNETYIKTDEKPEVISEILPVHGQDSIQNITEKNKTEYPSKPKQNPTAAKDTVEVTNSIKDNAGGINTIGQHGDNTQNNY